MIGGSERRRMGAMEGELGWMGRGGFLWLDGVRFTVEESIVGVEGSQREEEG